jgi:hypothetical protein
MADGLLRLDRLAVPQRCTKLVASACLALLGMAPGVHATPVRGTLNTLARSSPAAPLFLSVRTTEGMHTFSFRSTPLEDGVEGEKHFVGKSRRHTVAGGQETASLSLFHNTGFLYFSSRRRHRPHSVQFSLFGGLKGYELGKVRISSAPLLSLNCAVEGRKSTGSSALYPSRAPSTTWARMQRSSPTRILEVGAEADYAFFRKFGAQTRNYIRAALRAADTLYTSELGIRIKLTSLRVTNQGSSQTASVTAENVLQSFRRQSRTSRISTDVRHLFTGQQLDGSTIGLAYVGTACMDLERLNVGISQAVNRALQPVLAAHEIGHNLNAIHDGGKGSVMNPAPRSTRVSFSLASQQDIQSFVDSFGECLASAQARTP